jgi:integrase
MLADELTRINPIDADPDALVFGTATGAKQSASNMRNRVLAGATARADVTLIAADLPPLPRPLTPHSLRRTYISLLLALGKPVPYVMRQAGHTDPKMTLSIYAQVMDYGEGETDRRRALVDGESAPVVSARNGADSAQTGDQREATGVA